MSSPANPVSLLTGLFSGLVDKLAVSPFNLRRLEDFPFVEWSSMQEYYRPLIEWYEGTPLNEKITDKETGISVDKFPIKLNPIPGTCEKHCSVLLGNTLESIRESGMPIRFIPDSDVAEGDVEIIEDAIRKAFEYAGGGAMFVDAGIVSQYLGGSVWKVKFDDLNEDYPVQVLSVDPTEFFGIPKGSNYWDFHEAWMVREVTLQDAIALGYSWNQMDDKFYYVEHWTEKVFQTFVNDKTLKDEENIFGVVPFVYIPHIRVRNFIGRSIITEAVKGIIKEWNLRFGDIGDAVADDAHPVLATRGVRGSLGDAKLPDGRSVVNLGSKAGMGNNETDPDLFAVRTQITSAPMIEFTSRLEAQYRKEVKHPAVSDGEDEGSQRSAATLTVRMWPLISHVELERINWTAGMLKLAKIILIVYAKKSIDGVREDLVDAGFTIKWSSPLPRDREALINELAIRKKNGMTSLKHVLELLGDIEDVDREIALIDEDADKEQKREMAKMEAKAASSGFGDPSKKGNALGKNNQEKGDTSNTDAKNQLSKE